MRKFSLTYAFLLMGFTAIVAQVVLIRELLTSFSGNELAIGIFFANWVLLEASGSYTAGRWADKVKSGTSYYVSLQLFLSLALPAVIFFTRIIKNLLGIIPGQGINVFTVFYASFFLLTPLGLADGAQFSFGCRIFTEGKPKGAVSIGKVYIYEAIGSFVGGIVGTYLCLQHLNSFQTAFGLAFLNIVSAILLVIVEEIPPRLEKRGKWHGLLKVAAVLLFIVCILLFPAGGVEYLHKKSVDTQWRDYNVIDYRNSIYGNVTVLQRFEQFNIMSNGVPIATIPTPDITFIEEFVHLPLLFHKHPQHVLLIGGGIGGVLQEMLKHPIQKVDYAELDPLIIRAARWYAPSQTALDLDDSRVAVHYVDGRYFIRTSNKPYDVIFINLPDPSTLEINRFYTLEFYRMLNQRLKEGGILCFLFPGSTTYLSEELIHLNAGLIQTTKSIFPYIRVIPGEYNLLLAAADDSVAKITPDVLIQRMFERSLQTRLLSDFHIQYKFDEIRLKWYRSELEKAGKMPLNQDFNPSALYHDLMFWNSIHSPGFARIFTQLKRLRFGYIIAAIVLIFGLFFFLQRFRSRWKQSFIVLPIIATGFTGMGVDILLVLAFQSYYGYVYHWIGLLITAFMVGLTCGGTWMNRQLKKVIDEYVLFLKLEMFIVLYTALLIGVLLLLNRFQEYAFVFSAIQFILLLLNALCGFLVGAEFPLANSMYLKHTVRYTQTAGILYASDLIGSWFGSLFVTIVFIPLFGMLNTCLIMVFINLSSVFVFHFSKK